LVLAHIVDGVGVVDGNGGGESAARARRRQGTARLVARLAAEHGLSDRAEHRSAVGDPAALLGQIAAEEGVDLIVVGAPAGERRLRRSSESRLVEQLESATTVPVLFVPPRRGRWRSPRDGVGATVD
jgi:nucleotide-binding universal stress UspA family protein